MTGIIKRGKFDTKTDIEGKQKRHKGRWSTTSQGERPGKDPHDLKRNQPF